MYKSEVQDAAPVITYVLLQKCDNLIPDPYIVSSAVTIVTSRWIPGNFQRHRACIPNSNVPRFRRH